jgi:hypothetical protein
MAGGNTAKCGQHRGANKGDQYRIGCKTVPGIGGRIGGVVVSLLSETSRQYSVLETDNRVSEETKTTILVRKNSIGTVSPMEFAFRQSALCVIGHIVRHDFWCFNSNRQC